MYLEKTFIYLYIFIRNSYLAYLCNCIFWHWTNQLCVPPAHKVMVAVPIMKSISVCLSIRLPAHPSIHPIRPSVHPSARRPLARPSIHSSIQPSIHIYLSIYLQIWYRNVLVPKRLGAKTSWYRIVQGNFLGWCRNVLVPKRLGAEASKAESSRCRNDLVPKRL